MAASTWTPDPNRFACHVEAPLIRDAITVDEGQLSTLDAQVARFSSAVREAERQLAEAQAKLAYARKMHARFSEERAGVLQRLRESRGLLHPLRRVPFEILSEIFLFSMQLDGAGQEELSDEQIHCLSNAPYAFSQVSHKWRSVALRTPRFLTYVCVRFTSVSIGDYNLAWVSQLEERIRRSAPLPIQLLIDGYFPHHPYDDYDEDTRPGGYNAVSRDWISKKELWAPIMSALSRCQSIRMIACDNGALKFGDTAGLFSEDAPILESLSIRTHVISAPPLSFERRKRPAVHVNMHAPRLRKLELLGVQLSTELRNARAYYRCLTELRLHHVYGERDQEACTKALLARAPFLTSITNECGDADEALGWLAHPKVRHITLEDHCYPLRFPTLPPAAAFPMLESVDIGPAPLFSLERAFSPSGTFYAIHRLAYTAENLNAELVVVLDMLPYLEAVTLRDATFTPAFVAPDAWAQPGAPFLWRCPHLREVALLATREGTELVDGSAIVGWLGRRNGRFGVHEPFSRFQLTWDEGRPLTLDQQFEACVRSVLRND